VKKNKNKNKNKKQKTKQKATTTVQRSLESYYLVTNMRRRVKHDLSIYQSSRVEVVGHGAVHKILGLKDGTFITGSNCQGSIKRCTVNGNVLQTFCGNESVERITALMEVDDNTFVSTSHNYSTGASTFKVWNKTTGECHSIETPEVRCLLRLRNNSTFLCGVASGGCCIEERRLDNFEVVERLKHRSSVWCMCELSNGNVISGSSDKMIYEWDMDTKTVVRSFAGHKSGSVEELIELKDKTILSLPSNSNTVKIWNGTTGKCLLSLKHSKSVSAVVELSDGTLLMASDDKIYEWDDKGKCISTFKVKDQVLFSVAIVAMKGLSNGSIVIVNLSQIQVKQTWLR